MDEQLELFPTGDAPDQMTSFDRKKLWEWIESNPNYLYLVRAWDEVFRVVVQYLDDNECVLDKNRTEINKGWGFVISRAYNEGT